MVSGILFLPPLPPMNSRYLAAGVIAQVVIHHHALDVALANHLEKLTSRDQSFAKALCFGVIRQLWVLQAVEAQLLNKKIKAKDHFVRCLIWLGIYQIHWMHVANHAAIAQTVAAAKKLKQPWATGLINAVLRKFEQNPQQYLQTMNPETKYNHPSWLLNRLKQDWPKHYQDILHANNQQAPMYLRVNQQQCTQNEYLKILKEQGIGAFAVSASTTAVTLASPKPVEQLPYFAEGWVSVQDLAPQLAAPLLKLQPQQRVLDACAAPGGKTAHSLEIEPTIDLLSTDHDSKRLAKVSATLKRLNVRVNIMHANMLEKSWWDGRPFDRILLDAPCSATGVIRRHPDIKWLRKDSDIAQLAHTQLTMLENLWDCLTDHGILLYATCSVLHQENDAVIEQFLTQHPDASCDELVLTNGCKTVYGWQCLPEQQGSDGFYYARLVK